MADFSRTIIPARTSTFELPRSLKSWGQTGKVQTRTLGALGRSWMEEFPPLDVTAQATRAFLAEINDYLRSGVSFTIDHRDYQTPKGTGAGSPKVDGASQTGSSLDTKGWAASQTVLKKGDIFLVAGVPDAKDVLADVVSDGAGDATISLGPPILVGGSPADSAVLTVTGVKMTCILDDAVIPSAGPGIDLAGLKLVFRESL